MTNPSLPLEYWSIDGELVCITPYNHIGFQEDVGVCRRYYDSRSGEVWLERIVTGKPRTLWHYSPEPRCRRNSIHPPATPYEVEHDLVPTAILAWEFMERSKDEHTTDS